jgi:prepilin-type N-terminal cleavage/methylation domain-containing protein
MAGVHPNGAQRKTAHGLIHHSAFRIHPSAFTLVEVMLTLALLVIISAMAWPRLEKTFSVQRLRKGADIVRIQWCKARVEAMRTGSMRVFRYEIGGNHYRIDLLSTDPVALLTGTTVDTAANGNAQIAGANNATSQPSAGSLDATAPFFEQVLPKDITFVSSQTGLDPTTAAAGGSTSTAAAATPVDPTIAGNVSSAGTGWSEPIFFYPDGTTSDTRLLLTNKDGRTIEVWLRGITGIVKIGDIAVGQTGL